MPIPPGRATDKERVTQGTEWDPFGYQPNTHGFLRDAGWEAPVVMTLEDILHVTRQPWMVGSEGIFYIQGSKSSAKTTIYPIANTGIRSARSSIHLFFINISESWPLASVCFVFKGYLFIIVY